MVSSFEFVRSRGLDPALGGAVVGGGPETAVLLAKTATVVAGKPFFTAVFEELGCTVEWCVEEGSEVSSVPFKAAYVRGPCRNILLGERTALNILARASGIATAAREVVSIARTAGWHGEVAGTRKVTPGFRLVEKYALLVGGASTHRMDLSSMVMLKGAACLDLLPATPLMVRPPPLTNTHLRQPCVGRWGCGCRCEGGAQGWRVQHQDRGGVPRP